jgi:hypothetical protein
MQRYKLLGFHLDAHITPDHSLLFESTCAKHLRMRMSSISDHITLLKDSSPQIII